MEKIIANYKNDKGVIEFIGNFLETGSRLKNIIIATEGGVVRASDIAHLEIKGEVTNGKSSNN